MTFKVASYIYIAAHQSTWYWLRCSAKCTFWSFKDLNKKKERKTTPGAATPPHKQHHHHYTFLSLSTSTFYIILGPPLKAYIEVSDLPYLTSLRDWPTCGSSRSTSSTPSSSPTGSLQRGSRWFSTSVHSHQWFERWLNGDQNIILWNAIDIYSLLKIPKGAGSFKDCFLQSRACPEPF